MIGQYSEVKRRVAEGTQALCRAWKESQLSLFAYLIAKSHPTQEGSMQSVEYKSGVCFTENGSGVGFSIV